MKLCLDLDQVVSCCPQSTLYCSVINLIKEPRRGGAPALSLSPRDSFSDITDIESNLVLSSEGG